MISLIGLVRKVSLAVKIEFVVSLGVQSPLDDYRIKPLDDYRIKPSLPCLVVGEGKSLCL